MEFILSIFSLLSLGTAYFLAGRATKATNPLQSLFLFQLIGIPFFLFLLPFSPLILAPVVLTKILAVGTFYTFSMLLFFHAMNIGTISIVMALGDLYIIPVVLLGFFLLGESITPEKLFAITLIVIGGLFVSLNFSQMRKTKRLHVFAGVVPALFSIFGTALYVYWITELVRATNWLTVALCMRVAIALTTLVILVVRREKIVRQFTRIPWKLFVPAAIFDVIGFSLYNLAVTTGELSVVAAVVSAQALVVASLSYFFLKERLSRLQIGAMVVIVLGLITMQFV